MTASTTREDAGCGIQDSGASTPEAPALNPESRILNPDYQDHHIARMAAVALGLTVLENVIPSPLPGVKPGLANIVTLIVLSRYGWRVAAWVSLLRVVAGSLLFGSFLTDSSWAYPAHYAASSYWRLRNTCHTAGSAR
jgi:hypothetical protein